MIVAMGGTPPSCADPGGVSLEQLVDNPDGATWRQWTDTTFMGGWPHESACLTAKGLRRLLEKLPNLFASNATATVAGFIICGNSPAEFGGLRWTTRPLTLPHGEKAGAEECMFSEIQRRPSVANG